MKVYIPFAGFYESIHTDEIDHSIEMEMEYYEEKETPIDPDSCNYRKLYDEYAEKYAGAFFDGFKNETNISVDFEFIELESPSFYNFETDRIAVDISIGKIAVIHDYIVNNFWDEFSAFVKERFTSRSGFISFYDNDVIEWGDLSVWDIIQVSTMFDFIDSVFLIEEKMEIATIANDVVSGAEFSFA